MANVVLVIDMIRGFLEDGNPLYCGDAARRIVPRVQKLLEQEVACGSSIFYICDRHAPDDPEFNLFPPHCVAGSPEAEAIPELGDYPGEVIPKNRYSGFFDTLLEKKLRDLHPE